MKETLGDVKEVTSEKNYIEISCENGNTKLTVVTPKIIRVQMTKTDVYRHFDSYAVQQPLPQGEFLFEKGEISRMETENLILEITETPFSFRLTDKSGKAIQEDGEAGGMYWEATSFTLKKQMKNNTCFYGMGEKAHGLNKRGLRYVMWNSDNPDHDTESDPLYQSIPFFIVLEDDVAYGVFLDNTYKTWFDFGYNKNDEYAFGGPNGPIDYYIIYGPTMREVIDGYTKITGRPYFIPKWALGHQHSRWMEYESQDDVLQMARGLRSHKIPCDTMVLDILYMDEFKIFTWDSEVFPSPQELTNQLSEMAFKTMTIIDPGVKKEEGYFVFDDGVEKNCFLKKKDGSLFVGLVWPGLTVFPAFSRPEVRKWFGSYYQKQPKWGVSNSSWIDMNEPSIHEGLQNEYSISQTVTKDGKPWEPRLRNVYGLCMAEAAFSGLREAYPGERPFILTRSGFAGYQRYAATWTGDNKSTWEHLRLSVPMILNLGLSGVPFSGADIGGFGGDVTTELLARWYQLGSFYPFSRNHSQIETKRQEPWLFGEEVIQIARKYLSLRYRFMRYLYSLSWLASEMGTPVMRPLVLEFQEDENTHEIDTEFLIGPFLLIAPILHQGKTERSVYLPKGFWYDYWTGERFEGPISIEVSAPLDTMPIYCRGGSVIPAGEVVQSCQESQGDILLLIYPDGNGSFLFYQDDGISEDGPYAKTEIQVESDTESILIRLDEREGTWNPPVERLVLEVRGLTEAPKKLVVDNEENPVSDAYQSDAGLCWIELPNDGRIHEVEIQR
jgi:alpha-glucosidase